MRVVTPLFARLPIDLATDLRENEPPTPLAIGMRIFAGRRVGQLDVRSVAAAAPKRGNSLASSRRRAVDEFPGRQRIAAVTLVQFDHQRHHEIQGTRVFQPAAIDRAKTGFFDQLHDAALRVVIIAADQHVAFGAAGERRLLQRLPEGRFVCSDPSRRGSGGSVLSISPHGKEIARTPPLECQFFGALNCSLESGPITEYVRRSN